MMLKVTVMSPHIILWRYIFNWLIAKTFENRTLIRRAKRVEVSIVIRGFSMVFHGFILVPVEFPEGFAVTIVKS